MMKLKRIIHVVKTILRIADAINEIEPHTQTLNRARDIKNRIRHADWHTLDAVDRSSARMRPRTRRKPSPPEE